MSLTYNYFKSNHPIIFIKGCFDLIINLTRLCRLKFVYLFQFSITQPIQGRIITSIFLLYPITANSKSTRLSCKKNVCPVLWPQQRTEITLPKHVLHLARAVFPLSLAVQGPEVVLICKFFPDFILKTNQSWDMGAHECSNQHKLYLRH